MPSFFARLFAASAVFGAVRITFVSLLVSLICVAECSKQLLSAIKKFQKVTFCFNRGLEMAEEETKPVRVGTAILASIDPLRELLGYSQKRFVEDCVEAIRELAETPNERRTIPLIIALLDAAKKNQENPIKFPASEVLKRVVEGEKKKQQ